MARNDGILSKPDSGDVSHFHALVTRALQAKRKIETGFFELAESIFDIHRKKLYKVKYKTFNEFCEEELGFSRQTIYVYIAILKLVTNYPTHFNKEIAIEFGHKKMRYITEGINAIDTKGIADKEKERLKLSILDKVTPQMASTEIEAFIEDVISDV